MELLKQKRSTNIVPQQSQKESRGREMDVFVKVYHNDHSTTQQNYKITTEQSSLQQFFM